MPRSPEHNNRRPVAITPEVRPRRRRVYFVRMLEVKVYDQAADGWCLAMAITSTFKLLACVCIGCCAPCCSFLVVAQGRACYVHRAGLGKAAHPKLLRVSGGGERE